MSDPSDPTFPRLPVRPAPNTSPLSVSTLLAPRAAARSIANVIHNSFRVPPLYSTVAHTVRHYETLLKVVYGMARDLDDELSGLIDAPPGPMHVYPAQPEASGSSPKRKRDDDPELPLAERLEAEVKPSSQAKLAVERTNKTPISFNIGSFNTQASATASNTLPTHSPKQSAQTAVRAAIKQAFKAPNLPKKPVSKIAPTSQQAAVKGPAGSKPWRGMTKNQKKRARDLAINRDKEDAAPAAGIKKE